MPNHNRPKDFFAKQIRSSHLIASGGIIDPESDDLTEMSNLRLAIYPKETLEPGGTAIEGAYEGLVPETFLTDVGDNVWLFVSGTQNPVGSPEAGIVLFGGDVFVSGSIYTEEAAVTTTSITIVSGGNAIPADSGYLNPIGDTESRIVLYVTGTTNFVSVECIVGEKLLIELPDATEHSGVSFIIKDKLGNVEGVNTCIRIAPKEGQSLDDFVGWHYTAGLPVTTAYIDLDPTNLPLLFEQPYASISVFSDGESWLIF